MRAFCYAALLLAAAACAPPDTSAAAKAAIDATNDTWTRLTSTGHADSLAEYYEANAVIMPPNMPAQRGREAIRGFFGAMNGMSTPPPVLNIHADSVWGSGAAAVELGRWTFRWPATATRPPGAPPVDSGKYVVRWVQQNGRWLIAQDIWNSDTPLPLPPAPAPARKR